jgi:hypothetical protein
MKAKLLISFSFAERFICFVRKSGVDINWRQVFLLIVYNIVNCVYYYHIILKSWQKLPTFLNLFYKR